MPPKKKGDKKKGSTLNVEEMVKAGEMQIETFPEAKDFVVDVVTEKTFPVVYQDMKLRSRLFTHSSRLKDLYIHKLKQDFDVLDEQKTRLRQEQVKEIEDAMADFYLRRQKAFNEYERRRNIIIADRNRFLSQNTKLSKSELGWLQSFTYLLQEDNKEYNEFLFQDIRLEQYEKRQQSIVEINQYGEWVLQLVKQKCEKIQKIYQDYRENTRDKKNLYDLLKVQNHNDEISIDKCNRKIAKLEVQRKKASDLMVMTKGVLSSILDLQTETSTYDEAQIILRNRFVSETKEDHRRLENLSKISNQCIEELQGEVKLVEDVLKYARLCSKYETVLEKAQPHSSLILSVEIPVDKKFTRFRQIHRLLYRMAQTELQCDYMTELEGKYEEENKLLEDILRKVLNELSSTQG